MKIISQQGVEADMTKFGVRQGGSKWAVTGHLAGKPPEWKDYTLGVYGDKFTAVSVVGQVLQHRGAEPFKMPPEDTVV